MSLYKPYSGTTAAGNGDLFASNMTAFEQVVSTMFGNGIVSGLTVDSNGNLQTGDALIGHLVTVLSAVSLKATGSIVTSALTANATNYVWLQNPPSPATYPNMGYATGVVQATGKSTGLVICNTSGTQPANSVLLATVVTGAANSITSVNNLPNGRNNIVTPAQIQSLITLMSVKSLCVLGSIPAANNYLSWRVPFPCTLQTFAAACNSAPVGQSQIIDVTKNGVSIFSVAGNRCIIAVGATSGTSALADNGATCAVGDIVQVNVVQAGTTPMTDFMGDLYYQVL